MGDKTDEIRRVDWGSRFWAWLIDVLLVGLLWNMICGVLHLSWSASSGSGLLLAMLFIYWTALEGYRGQSVGKMMQNLVVVGLGGEKIGFSDAAVESFGKAFLLPLDCLLGWYLLRGSGQRAFNRLSDTVVVAGDEHGIWCCRKR
ncbi:MAG: RDD family protein [Methanosaeta sp. PtaB.Bin039]|nr:MAG: RDD family protein [Methanosaeta sp. PtaB.Bin039]OPY45580.1 MAG: RDD family protein [Methanosaeta sp. PtaU1.Bin028]HQF17228.1 RDD family protein [Methanotrichaceae archaeon]HQI91801.1 RDD family protein [Methanotrichaceae archaeon]